MSLTVRYLRSIEAISLFYKISAAYKVHTISLRNSIVHLDTICILELQEIFDVSKISKPTTNMLLIIQVPTNKHLRETMNYSNMSFYDIPYNIFLIHEEAIRCSLCSRLDYNMTWIKRSDETSTDRRNVLSSLDKRPERVYYCAFEDPIEQLGADYIRVLFKHIVPSSDNEKQKFKELVYISRVENSVTISYSS